MEWTIWKGKTIKKICTDGSYKEEKTQKTMMLGGHRIKAGGGIAILTDDGLFSPLRVLMDIEVDSAFPVETISLMAGCVIAEGMGEIEIGSDCLGAMAAVDGRTKDFKRLLGPWKHGRNIKIKKVKAYPEKREGVW